MTVDSIIVKERVGIPARLIPWDSSPQVLNALIRGDIQIALLPTEGTQALLAAGEIKLLATFTEKSDRPGVPSIKDLGYPDLVEKVGSQRFVIAPPDLPKEIRDILVASFEKVFSDKEFLAWANKGDITLNPLYGDEAQKISQRLIIFLQEDLKPILMKYLK